MHNHNQSNLDQTIQWFNQVVLGLNLCPFAHSPARSDAIRWVAVEEVGPSALFEVLHREVQSLIATDESNLATTVLIVPRGLEDFEDYLDMLAFLNDWLDEAGLSRDFQLASFHPNYQFEGRPLDDRANWTNRSPLPLFHIIREASITKVLDSGADTGAIVDRNVRTLRTLPTKKMRELFPHFKEH